MPASEGEAASLTALACFAGGGGAVAVNVAFGIARPVAEVRLVAEARLVCKTTVVTEARLVAKARLVSKTTAICETRLVAEVRLPVPVAGLAAALVARVGVAA